MIRHHFATDYTRNLDFDMVKAMLGYDPLTGDFTWLVDRTGVTKAGMLAGRVSCVHGYREIKIFGVRYHASRLAFIFMLDRWPEKEVDHLNGHKDDNRWRNLREVTRSGNSKNSTPRPNKNGHTGISIHKNGYSASISDRGNRIYLGFRGTLGEAIELRKSAEKKYGYTERHGMK